MKVQSNSRRVGGLLTRESAFAALAVVPFPLLPVVLSAKSNVLDFSGGLAALVGQQEGWILLFLGFCFAGFVAFVGWNRLNRGSGESLECVHRILEGLSCFAGLVDLDGVLREVNRAALELGGISATELLGKKFWDCDWWNHSPEVQAQLREMLDLAAQGHTVRRDVVMRTTGNLRMTLDFQVAPLRDRYGRITGVIPSGVDITERKRVEKALREHSELMRAVTESTTDLIYAKDCASRMILANPATLATVGKTADEVLGRCEREWHGDPEQAAAIMANDQRVIESGRSEIVEEIFTTPGGPPRSYISTKSPLRDSAGNVIGIVGISREISELKRAEQAVRESEKRLEAVVENLTEGLIIADSTGRILHWNPAALAIHGYTNLEECRKKLSEFSSTFELRSLDTGRVLSFEEWPMPRIFRGETVDKNELRLRRVDQGWERICSYGGSMIRSAWGEMLAFLSVTDVTDRKCAEAALRQSEQRLRLALDAARAGTFDIDLSGKSVDVSPGLPRLLGLGTQAQVELEVYFDCIHPKDRQRVIAEIDRSVSERIGHYAEYRVVQSSGQERWLASRAEPVLGSEGSVVRLIGAVIDVTERRAAEHALRERERMLLLALDASEMGAWDLDVATGRSQMTERARKIFGFSPSAPVSLSSVMESVYPQDRRPMRLAVQRAMEEGEDYAHEYRIVRPNGELRWILSRGRPIADDTTREIVRIVGVSMDITERKLTEQALSQAKENAEAANRAKDEFLAALSHELRTPLNPVLMLTSELEQSPELSESVRDDFAMIRKNIELEARLIDDLLDLTRITRGKLHLEIRTLDVHALVRHALGIVRGEIEAKKLALTVDLAARLHHVSGDSVRLQQVFWNVIKNAVKFTPVGGAVTVRSRINLRGDLEVEVIDTGLGIEPAEMARIFNAFNQGDHVNSHQFGGLGLGLAICSLIVQLHNGAIHAESAGRGLGATFRIELPLAEAAAPVLEPSLVPEQKITNSASDRKRRILLVEDHEPTRATLVRLLSRRGFDVLPAGNLAAAREGAANSPIDFVISDIGLPDGTGHALMSELHEQYGLTGIALSGYGMEEDVERSIASGFSAHLTKPVDIQALERAIAEIGFCCAGIQCTDQA